MLSLTPRCFILKRGRKVRHRNYFHFVPLTSVYIVEQSVTEVVGAWRSIAPANTAAEWVQKRSHTRLCTMGITFVVRIVYTVNKQCSK